MQHQTTFDELTMPPKKRIAPTFVGPFGDNGDDVSVRLTDRQIAMEEAKAEKAQAEFHAKRRAKEQSKKKKELRLKRKREEEATPSSPPPVPQQITVKRKTQLIRGKTKRQRLWQRQ